MAKVGTTWLSVGTPRPTFTSRLPSHAMRRGCGRYRDFLQGPLDEGEVTMEAVRHKAVEFYRSGE
jgi:hypothetical protein